MAVNLVVSSKHRHLQLVKQNSYNPEIDSAASQITPLVKISPLRAGLTLPASLPTCCKSCELLPNLSNRLTFLCYSAFFSYDVLAKNRQWRRRVKHQLMLNF
jgi:hypothetical protein